MVNSEYLKNLNKAQKEAVMYLDGPLLIVAGAGSGKTKVLTTRIANIIREKKSISQSNTFSNFYQQGCQRNANKSQQTTWVYSGGAFMAWYLSLNLCKTSKETCFSS